MSFARWCHFTTAGGCNWCYPRAVLSSELGLTILFLAYFKPLYDDDDDDDDNVCVCACACVKHVKCCLHVPRHRGLKMLVGGDRRMFQFSDRQLQISDRRDYGCLQFQFCP